MPRGGSLRRIFIAAWSEIATPKTPAPCSLKYHVVWCPKYRRPVLVPPVDRRLKALVNGDRAGRVRFNEQVHVVGHHLHLMHEEPVLSRDFR